MEIKIYQGYKLFTLSKTGFEEISVDKVKVSFVNGKPLYQLIDGDQEQMIVQAHNCKKAASKMLQLLIEKQRKK